MAENLWGKVVTTSDLEPIESSLGSINTKVDNLDTKLDTSNSKIENVKTSIGLNTDAENTNSIFGKLNGIRNQWTTFWNTWTSARAAKLDNLDTTISSRAPSNTALSTATWTNARAAKLDNLDALISSRAPASTALSTAQWTNTRAGYLDAAISSRASQASLNSLHNIASTPLNFPKVTYNNIRITSSQSIEYTVYNASSNLKGVMVLFSTDASLPAASVKIYSGSSLLSTLPVSIYSISNGVYYATQPYYFYFVSDLLVKIATPKENVQAGMCQIVVYHN